MLKQLFFAAVFVSIAPLDARISPQEALEQLKSGNHRYVHDDLLQPNRDFVHRETLQSSQEPFAVIIGCSDSRVSPEIIFDQGLGDLFIIRVAGNVVGPIEQDSVDYAVLNLGASLIVVLGHENCGAINAVCQNNTKGIEAIARLIEPSLSHDKKKCCSKLENAIKTNVEHVVDQLKHHRMYSELLIQGKLAIVGGYYQLGTGAVSWL